jgi:hypothetical protein
VGLTCEVGRERATGIEPRVLSSGSPQEGVSRPAITDKSPDRYESHLFGGIRCCPLFAVACGTKLREFAEWPAVARDPVTALLAVLP